MQNSGYGARNETSRKWLAGAMAAGLAIALPGHGLAQDAETGEENAPYLLEGIVVEGDPGAVTEGTESYATDRATVGSKQPTALRDIPQTVNVLTRERLDDAGVTSIEEAAYLLPNVATATGDTFSGSLYSRGHEVFTYNVDGAPRPFLSLYGTTPDLYFFDRIEVLSGPSGLFQGSGEPVGTINLVRKRPYDTFGANAGAYYGTFGSYRGEADVSAPLTEDGSIRARLVGFAQHQDSYVDISDQEKQGVYGTVEFDIGEATTLSVGGIGGWEDTTRFSGLPAFTDGRLINLDRSTYIGADWNNFDSDAGEAFTELEHEFDDGSVLKMTGRYYARYVDNKSVLGLAGVDPVTGNFPIFVFARDYNESTSYIDANWTSPIELFGREGETQVGVDYRYTDSGFKQNFDLSLGMANIYNFDARSIPEPNVTFPGVGPGFRLNTTTHTSEVGGYAQGRMEVIDDLDVTLGARVPYYRSEARDTGRHLTTSDIHETRFVPYAGVGYDILPEATLYTSYTEIFQPQAEQTATGAQLDPIVGRQVEFGVKGDVFENVNVQAAYFWLQDKNQAEADPINPGAFTASGEAITQGFEASAVGEVMDGLSVSLGYAYVATQLDTDPTPKNNVVLWGKYTLQEGPLEGVYLGLGMRAASGFYNQAGAVRINAPGYTVFDALVGYDVYDGVSIQGYIENLFDRTYYERVNELSRGNFYGNPINATISLKATF